jgi:beta-N-acetylhexosaminidase
MAGNGKWSSATTRLLLTIALGALLAAGVVVVASNSGAGGSRMSAATASVPPPYGPASAQTRTIPSGPGVACDAVVSAMTARQRLAQLVVVGVEGDDPEAAAEAVRREQIGGLFIGGNATQLLRDNALAKVQAAARGPVSHATDEEGGRVQRIDELDGSIPSARKMAQTMTTAQVHQLARRRGEAMKARGVTADYAPDADVTDQPDRSVIGDRSFSPDPRIARDYAVAFATGLREAGVEPVLKHFPGHGHATGDSHRELVSTPPLASLRAVDLVPYDRIADYGQVSVMVGHLNVPDLTAGEPASLSAPAYRLLRTEYGFYGPVVTDDLGAMRAIADRYPLPEAVLHALQAGADQALWSSNGRTGEVLDRLERAVASGELSEARVRESLDRVLKAKQACRP